MFAHTFQLAEACSQMVKPYLDGSYFETGTTKGISHSHGGLPDIRDIIILVLVIMPLYICVS